MNNLYGIVTELGKLILHLNAQGFDTTKLSRASTLIVEFNNDEQEKLPPGEWLE